MTESTGRPGPGVRLGLRGHAAGLVGKAVAGLARLRGGHASAFPGLVVERLDPRFLANVLGGLPLGVVVVSGTNGKTTTTKMVVELLRAAGLRVFTNPSGSNFTRGVVSEAVQAMRHGRLDADIAVVEQDEAYAVHFVRQVAPRACLLLNVLRDQLDRFGEIDTTARLLRQVAEATTDAVVLNADDPRIAALAEAVPESASVSWFGVDASLAAQFPTDEQLHGSDEQAEQPPTDSPNRNAARGGRETSPTPNAGSRAERQVSGLVLGTKPGTRRISGAPYAAEDDVSRDVVRLSALAGQQAAYRIDGQDHPVELSLYGPHNALNGAAALALAKAVLGDGWDAAAQVAALGRVRAAFGRGEIWRLGPRQLRLTLVKNPSGFRLALAGASPSTPTLVAINDEHADGRDVSWLWDVEFDPIADSSLVRTTGVRAADIALRLEYAGVGVDDVDAELARSLTRFLADTDGQDVQIFSTYTAMLKLRAQLKGLAGTVAATMTSGAVVTGIPGAGTAEVVSGTSGETEATGMVDGTTGTHGVSVTSGTTGVTEVAEVGTTGVGTAGVSGASVASEPPGTEAR